MIRKEVGNRGERIAKDFLKKKGYRIIEMNYHCREGEIDIVAKKKDYLVFIEVRTKTGAGYGSPEESITSAKKEKLIASALSYIDTHNNLPSYWRIDFVAVELDDNGKARRTELFENIIN